MESAKFYAVPLVLSGLATFLRQFQKQIDKCLALLDQRMRVVCRRSARLGLSHNPPHAEHSHLCTKTHSLLCETLACLLRFRWR
jgi:hypothetical protein